MENQNKKNCCNGCQKGQPGNNASCKAKQMAEKLKEEKEKRMISTKN
ncbi:hypothetical protein LX95_01800 [Mesonia algae]|uniref:Uncharacterized protein n=1 Tax=Mesonia algae TaxID=213248 RepID=A0A2W7I5I0_9FLAO|nr:hypothetical protein [Mesonia algae]PZW40732.1 hypothetical protein LX95_01800 [Mesonia algae]